MDNGDKKQLEQRVVLSAREYGIASVLFRHAVGEKLGLNVTDMECLGVLFHNGISTPTELSMYTGLSSGATTAMLDRLEKSGLIKRQPNPSDRRGVQIVIDAKGAKKVAPLFMAGREAQDAIVASYSEEELKVLLDFFQQFAEMWHEERQRLGS